VTNIFQSHCDDIYPNEAASKHAHSFISHPTPILNSSSNNSTTDGFVVYYNPRTRNPLCVVEKISYASIAADKQSGPIKRPPFFADNRVDLPFKVNPKVYSDSKYDRGHMAPAADFAGDPNMYKETFTMANISPQSPALNQGFWSRFEAWLRGLIFRRYFEEIIIFTGPVFAPIFIQNQWIYMNRTIGAFPNLVSVPTHFFKVIIAKRKGKGQHGATLSLGAFLIPNSDTVEKSSCLNQFVVRLDQLESIVGFRFLPETIETKTLQAIDDAVPSSRDLAIVLNARNMIGEHKEVQLQDIGHPQLTHSSSKRESAVDVLSNPRRKPTDHEFQTKILFAHLCATSGIDCSKSLSNEDK